MAAKKALVLSGGGGRGAYHVGALKCLHEIGWLGGEQPLSYVAGTSIGALHAAAIAAGMSWEQIWERWQNFMTTENINTPVGPKSVQLFLSSLLHGNLTPEPEQQPALGGGQSSSDESPALGGGWNPFGWIDDAARGVFGYFLQENHFIQPRWREVIELWGPEFDFAQINSPQAPVTVITATDLRRGTKQLFCNRPWLDWEGRPQPATQIGPDHLNASASIQVFYQPGEAIETASGEQRFYWDGATVDNSPLDSLLDVAGREELDIVVVLMTPWHRSGADEIPLPRHLYETFTPALDWMMLAPFRVALKRLSDRGQPQPRIIAPKAEFWRQYMALDRTIEYKLEIHEKLFEAGYDDAWEQFPDMI